MRTISTNNELRGFYTEIQLSNTKIGFVPTMGALHDGHLSLLARAKAENDLVVVSIFVNPTQFNDPKDLEKYPRSLASDALKLAAAGCDVLYAPSVEEVYGGTIEKQRVDYGVLTAILEGAKRPGHYDGVVQVVRRLFEIVLPSNAYFGKKDFQQVAIIREMVRREALPVNIVPCDLIRDEDGLALSSRNALLSNESRQHALVLVHTLRAMKAKFPTDSPKAIEHWGRIALEENPHVQLEYLEVLDGKNFEQPEEWENFNSPMALVAAFVGGVRLIDNMEFIVDDEVKKPAKTAIFAL